MAFLLLSISYSSSIGVDQKKEYMKKIVEKMVDNMTRESYIPTDSVKSRDDYSSLVHNIGTEAYVDSDQHTWVKVMICWVGNIRKKRPGCNMDYN